MSFSSSSFSWLHSHLKTAGAVQSLFPLLLQYGLASQGAQPAPPSVRLLSFFGCPLRSLPGHCLPPMGPMPLARGYGWDKGLPGALGQQAQGMIFAEFSPRQRWMPAKMDASQDGCQPAPGHG